jgi:hypothetical protein
MASGSATAWRAYTASRSGENGAFGELALNAALVPLVVKHAMAPGYATAKIGVDLACAQRHAWQWRGVVNPDDLVVICDDTGANVLFAGFVADGEFRFAADEECTITAVGMGFRLLRDSDRLVYGRMMTSKDGPALWYNAFPCSFNAGGQANRTLNKVQATATDGQQVDVYAFTADQQQTGMFWHAFEAIDYLLALYNHDQLYVSNPQLPTESPIVVADVEGLGLWAAVAKVADAAGYDVFETFTSGGQCELAILKRGKGQRIVLQHQASAVGAAYPVLDTGETNLFAARVAEATASCVTRPHVQGGQDLFEITVPLQIAFATADLPAAGTVILPGQEDASAATDYVKRYCVGGTEFTAHAATGRLWEANEDGWFDDAIDGIDTPDIAALCGLTAGSWPKIPYRPLPMLTKIAAAEGGDGAETFVEFTVDDGATWYPLSGYRLHPARLGVYLTCRNLAAIGPYGGTYGTDDLMSKLIADNTKCRLRLTCCVASPCRRLVRPARRSAAGTCFETAVLVDKGALGQNRRRAASSRFKGTTLPADETSPDLTELTAAATLLQEVNEARLVEAGLTLEWIDSVNTPMGGLVGQISGIGVSLASGSRVPRVVGREFLLSAETYQTVLYLDTDRQQAVV